MPATETYCLSRSHLDIPVRLVLDRLDADLPELSRELIIFGLVGLGVDLRVSGARWKEAVDSPCHPLR